MGFSAIYPVLVRRRRAGGERRGEREPDPRSRCDDVDRARELRRSEHDAKIVIGCRYRRGRRLRSRCPRNRFGTRCRARRSEASVIVIGTRIGHAGFHQPAGAPASAPPASVALPDTGFAPGKNTPVANMASHDRIRESLNTHATELGYAPASALRPIVNRDDIVTRAARKVHGAGARPRLHRLLALDQLELITQRASRPALL